MALSFTRQEKNIRTTTIKSTPVGLRQSRRKGLFGLPKLKRRSQKRLLRYSILAVNALLLVAVIGFVVKHPSSTQAVQRAALDGSVADQANPLDQLSSADIAAHVAQIANMPETTAVVNQADSFNAQLSLVSADDQVIVKPQVITTQVKSVRDLQRYVVQAGDTVPSLAAKFGITSETIRTSNMLTSDSLRVGQELWISPVNGIVYTVKAGDTPASLAARFGVSQDVIIAFNDAEVGGLAVGRRIVIPEGRSVQFSGVSSSGVAGFRLFGGGGYDAGWCTAYAAAKAGVPGGWGNANTWHIYAALSGWTVSTVPRVGAVAQTSVGWAGHVGIVEAVSPDGTMIKYSDMNGLAGFNRVGYSDWVPAIGKYQRFIYH